MTNNSSVRILDPKFLSNGSRKWPLSNQEAQITVEYCASSSSLNSFLELHSFTKTHTKNVTDWTYNEFVCSALSEVFEGAEIPVFAWSLIIGIIMNSFLSDTVLLFLENNRFYNQAEKEKIIKGVSFAFKHSRFPFATIKCLKNILRFFDIEKSVSDKLIDSYLVRKDFKIITDYLFSTLEQK